MFLIIGLEEMPFPLLVGYDKHYAWRFVDKYYCKHQPIIK